MINIVVCFLAAPPLYSSTAECDLRTYDFHRSEPVSLAGLWMFYPSQFIAQSGMQKSMHAVPVPSIWNNTSYSVLAKGKGYASYTREIMLPPAPARYGILFRDAASAYRIRVYSNNQRVFDGGAGTAAISAHKTIPWFAYTCAEMQLSGNVTIIFDVANFDLAQGGLWNAPVLGSAEKVQSYRELIIARDFFLIGILFLVAAFCLILFFRIRSNRSPLYLAVFCILMAFRTLITGLYPQKILPTSRTAFSLLYTLDYLTMSAGVPILILYLQNVFFRLIKKKISAAIYLAGILLSFIVIFLPISVFSRLTTILWAYIILSLITVIVAFIIETVTQKDTLSVLSCTALIIFMSTIFHDILYSLQYMGKTLIAPYGFAAFIIVQGYVVAETQIRSQTKIKHLENTINDIHHNFDEMVKSRVDDLQAVVQKKKRDAQCRVSAETQDKVAHAIEYLQKNYMFDIAREGLAAQADLSPSRFGKAFLACTGLTMHNYMEQLRVNASLKFLRETALSITEIAHNTGFDSLSTFNRAFKKLIGITPSDYRNESTMQNETLSHDDLQK